MHSTFSSRILGSTPGTLPGRLRGPLPALPRHGSASAPTVRCFRRSVHMARAAASASAAVPAPESAQPLPMPAAAPPAKGPSYNDVLLSWVWKEPGLLLASLVANIASVLSYLLIAPALGAVIDTVSQAGSTTHTLLSAIGYLSFMYLFTNISLVAQVTFAAQLAERVAKNLRASLFASLMHKPLSYYDRARVGDLMASLGPDVDLVRDIVVRLFGARGVRAAIELVGVVGVLSYLSWKMAILLVISVPLVGPATSILTRKIQAISALAQGSQARAASVADEAIDSIRTIRVFGLENRTLANYGEQLDDAHRSSTSVAFLQGLLSGCNRLTTSFSIMATIGYGAWLAFQGEVSTGLAYSFFVYSLTLGISLGTLSATAGEMARTTSAIGRVLKLLDSSSTAKPDVPSITGDVELRNVAFSYPSREGQVLSGVTVRIPAGRVYALVGPSGSGKSTIGGLLLRLYEPDSGEVLVDGRPVTEYDINLLRRKVGLVQQDPTLFSGSVLDNIRYGSPDATQEQVEEAAQAAQAHGFISQLPMGYDTVIGERGVALSGGQRQRIALARNLLRDPQILILDEATSALDVESEAAVTAALRTRLRGRTVIVIAHRLSTVREADQIVVLDKGRVREQGTHDMLMLTPGSLYRSLVNLAERPGSAGELGESSEDEWYAANEGPGGSANGEGPRGKVQLMPTPMLGDWQSSAAASAWVEGSSAEPEQGQGAARSVGLDMEPDADGVAPRADPDPVLDAAVAPVVSTAAHASRL